MDGLPQTATKGEALITQIREVVLRHGYSVIRANGEPADGPWPDNLQFITILVMALDRAKGEAARLHVHQLLIGVAQRASRSGPVQVRLAAWALLLSYAEHGKPPAATEQVIAPRPGARGQRVFP